MSKKKKKSEPAPPEAAPAYQAVAPAPAPSTPDPAANYKPSVQTPEGFSSVRDIEFNYEKQLKSLQGDIDREVESIRSNAVLGAAQAQAGATVKSAELSTAAQRYVAEVGRDTAFGVSEREQKGRLDLQAIVNAGLKDVAGIETEAQKAVATTQGEYSLKGEKERQRGQRDIADLSSARQIYAGLVGAFNF